MLGNNIGFPTVADADVALHFTWHGFSFGQLTTY